LGLASDNINARFDGENTDADEANAARLAEGR
jgi:hypothetical protein